MIALATTQKSPGIVIDYAADSEAPTRRVVRSRCPITGFMATDRQLEQIRDLAVMMKKTAKWQRQPRCMSTGRWIRRDGGHAKVTEGPAWCIGLNDSLYSEGGAA